MVRLEMKNCNMILTEKQQKFQHCLKKIDKYEYLTGEEILSSNQREITEQAKLAYSPLGKTVKKHTEKHAAVVKSLKAFNKKVELKRIEGINQNVINQKVEKFTILVNILCLVFLKTHA